MLREYIQNIKGFISFFAPIDALAASSLIETAVREQDAGERLYVDLVREDHEEEGTGFEFQISGEVPCSIASHAATRYQPAEDDVRGALDIEELKSTIRALLRAYDLDFLSFKEEFEAAY